MTGKVLSIVYVYRGNNCAHPEGSAFLSLVLSAARSQFSCFSQRCTDPQVGLHKHRANVNWGGLSHCALAQGLDCTQTHTRLPSLMILLMMGGKFDPVSCASLLFSCHCQEMPFLVLI